MSAKSSASIMPGVPDEVSSLPELGKKPAFGIERQSSRASVTAASFGIKAGGNEAAFNKHIKDNKAEHEAEISALMNAYDTDRSGTFDRTEVRAIIVKGLSDKFDAVHQMKASKRIAETLNASNSSKKRLKQALVAAGALIVGLIAVVSNTHFAQRAIAQTKLYLAKRRPGDTAVSQMGPCVLRIICIGFVFPAHDVPNSSSTFPPFDTTRRVCKVRRTLRSN